MKNLKQKIIALGAAILLNAYAGMSLAATPGTYYVIQSKMNLWDVTHKFCPKDECLTIFYLKLLSLNHLKEGVQLMPGDVLFLPDV
ncbi:hypothetical protein ACT26D_06370 [Megasphaera elsdenii]|uniref:hypothetical protein n=1 Tax=Megasphaera elsdenii TaxID=907 RepID=UPI00403600D4